MICARIYKILISLAAIIEAAGQQRYVDRSEATPEWKRRPQIQCFL